MNDLFLAQNSGISNNLKQSKSQPELKALVGWILLNTQHQLQTLQFQAHLLSLYHRLSWCPHLL